MPVIAVDDPDDARLNDYRNVSDAELLRRSNLFVAEGRIVVRRLLASGHQPVSFLLNQASFKSLEAEADDAFRRLPVYVCSPEVLARVVGFNFHRGCMALARRRARSEVADVVKGSSLLLFLEGVTDPDNVGSAFRNAAAFGVDAVLLAACCDPLYRKAVRTSMGHVLQMPYASSVDTGAALAVLKSAGFCVVALTPACDAVSLADFARTCGSEKIVVLVGSEAEGLSAAAEGLADARVRIPMHSGVDSLNLSTAVGITLDRLVNR